MGVFPARFRILGQKIFSDKYKIFQQFSDSPKFRGGDNCPFPFLLYHEATGIN